MVGHIFAVAADLARSEGIADAGLSARDRTSGGGAASPSTTCTSTSWVAARSNGRPADSVAAVAAGAPGRGVRRRAVLPRIAGSGPARSQPSQGPTRTAGPAVGPDPCRARPRPRHEEPRPPGLAGAVPARRRTRRFTATPRALYQVDPARRRPRGLHRRLRVPRSDDGRGRRRAAGSLPRDRPGARSSRAFGTRHIIRLVGRPSSCTRGYPKGADGPAPAGHPDGPRDARRRGPGPVLRSAIVAPRRHRQRRQPPAAQLADRVALDLERVGPREVLARPQPPAGDPLVRPERRVGGLDRGVDPGAERGRLLVRASARTTASIRPGSVSTTTASRSPAMRSAFSMSSG